MGHILLVCLVCAFAAMAIGFVWYNPAVFGKAWQKASGLSDEDIRGANMPLIFGLAFVFSFLLAFALFPATIHQWGLNSMMNGVEAMNDQSSEAYKAYIYLMDNYGNNFRTFKHGALHGFIYSIFIALPLIGVNALYDRRSGKYILINWGYWAVVMTVMGGIICAWV